MGAEPFEVIQTEPAYAWHTKQKVVMNEAGRRALLKALLYKKSEIEVFCHDGEGYTLELVYGEDYIRPYYRIIDEEVTK